MRCGAIAASSDATHHPAAMTSERPEGPAGASSSSLAASRRCEPLGSV